MPLIPFAKARDVQTLVPCDDAVAELVVRVVSAGIRSAVHWDVDFAAGRTYEKLYRTRAVGWTGDPALSGLRTQTGSVGNAPVVVLPARNVTEITSVVVDGRTLAAEEWDATKGGIVYLTVRPVEVVTVTYSAGYVRQPEDTAPGAFFEVCLDHACALASNPERLRSWTQGGASESFPDRPDPVEDPRLDPYRVEAL